MTVEVWLRDDAVKLVIGDRSLDIPTKDLPHLIDQLQEVVGPRVGIHFNDIETQRLKNLVADGMNRKEIAKAMNRPLKTIDNKLYNLRREGKL